MAKANLPTHLILKTVTLNPRSGWQGIWPGWRALLDPENGRIQAFLREEAQALPAGIKVLDAGAGTRPFAAYFGRQIYASCDMPGGFYKQQHDFECFLHDIPMPSDHYDCIINTQVLEHVPDPLKTLREMNRVLKPGGILLLTVPLNAPLHGEPWHFHHFTHHALGHLAHESNYELIRCEKIGGAFWNLGKRLPDAFRKLLKQWDPGRARKRGQNLGASILMTLLLLVPWVVFYPLSAFVLRPLFYWLDRFDIEKSFTLGYTAVLQKRPHPTL